MKTVNTFANESEYLQAIEKYNLNNEATRKYLSDNKTNCIPVEITKTFPFADFVTNELRSKIETWEFINDKPERYFIYIDEKEKVATTWMGDKLGSVVYFGREYRSNMGDKRQSVDIAAINGIKYYGTYYKDAGSYARIKAYKTK